MSEQDWNERAKNVTRQEVLDALSSITAEELIARVQGLAHAIGEAGPMIHPHRLRAFADLVEHLPTAVSEWYELQRRMRTLEGEITKRGQESEHALQALRDQHAAETGAAEKQLASLRAERDAVHAELDDVTVRLGVATAEYQKLDEARRELNEKLAAVRG